MMPKINPTLNISLVRIIPVEAAMALGGVEIGSVIANEQHIAT